MVKFKIYQLWQSGSPYFFYRMLVGKSSFIAEFNYTRESDARRGAKRVAKNLGIVYEEIK